MCFPSDPLEVADMMEAAAAEIRRISNKKWRSPKTARGAYRRFTKLDTLLTNIAIEIEGVTYTTKKIDKDALAHSFL